MQKKFILYVFMLFAIKQMTAQPITGANVKFTINGGSHNYDCGSDGFFTNPEPRWKVRVKSKNGTYSPVQVFNLGNNISCGNRAFNYTFPDITSCDTILVVEIETWEDDGCGSDDNFDNTCTNDDENHSISIFNIDFRQYNAGVLKRDTLLQTSGSGYETFVEYSWTAVPNTTISATTDTVCVGNPALLTAQTNGALASVYWFADSLYSQLVFSGNIFTPTISQDSIFWVAAVNGTCLSEPVKVDVKTYPKVQVLSLTSNQPLCEGDTLKLATTKQPGITNTWTGPNGFTSTLDEPMVLNVNEADHQGFYSVVAKDNTTGCTSAVKSTLVNISSKHSVFTVSSNSPLCEGEALKLNTSSVYGASYAWSGPNGFSSSVQNPTISAATSAQAGNYRLIVTVGTCAVDTAFISVSVNSKPIANAGIDDTVIENSKAVLKGMGGVFYAWSPANYVSDKNSATPFITAPIGTHEMVLQVINQFNCSAYDTVLVTVLPQEVSGAMNIITPNGDGLNDVFVLAGLQNLTTSYTFRIIDRNGAELVNTNSYQNNWDGKYNGKELPEATYWWILNTADSREYKGVFTLKR